MHTLSQGFLRFLTFGDLFSMNVSDPCYTFLSLKLCGICSIGFVVIVPSTDTSPETPAAI